jgi:hypothetical protein
MYLHDHYFDDPFFFSSCIEFLRLGLSLRKVLRINLAINFILIEYLKNILNIFKLIFRGF